MSGETPTAGMRFIVKYLDKYYLTQEVWTFDPSMDQSKLTEDQKHWLEQVPILFGGSTEIAEGVKHVEDKDVAHASQINGPTGAP